LHLVGVIDRSDRLWRAALAQPACDLLATSGFGTAYRETASVATDGLACFSSRGSVHVLHFRDARRILAADYDNIPGRSENLYRGFVAQPWHCQKAPRFRGPV